jgi:hypothetical protein
MVPRFRRDDVWTPVFTGVTAAVTFRECVHAEHVADIGNDELSANIH